MFILDEALSKVLEGSIEWIRDIVESELLMDSEDSAVLCTFLEGERRGSVIYRADDTFFIRPFLVKDAACMFGDPKKYDLPTKTREEVIRWGNEEAESVASSILRNEGKDHSESIKSIYGLISDGVNLTEEDAVSSLDESLSPYIGIEHGDVLVRIEDIEECNHLHESIPGLSPSSVLEAAHDLKVINPKTFFEYSKNLMPFLAIEAAAIWIDSSDINSSVDSQVDIVESLIGGVIDVPQMALKDSVVGASCGRIVFGGASKLTEAVVHMLNEHGGGSFKVIRADGSEVSLSLRDKIDMSDGCVSISTESLFM